MAKERPDLEKFFQIAGMLQAGLGEYISDEDLNFYYVTTPDINEKLITDYIEERRKATNDPNYEMDIDKMRSGLMEAQRQLQTNPILKEKTIRILQEKEGQAMSEKLDTGLSILLGGVDIANSLKQIARSEQEAARNKKPTRAAIPQRDQLLQQALRSAELGTFDQERALAPLRAEIQDTYQSDIANAQIASGGQAAAYGAYRQAASDRKNRAALQLAPIADSIRSREQQRYDQLLGMRVAETQQMFNNQNLAYTQDLNQYNKTQEAAAALGATGRLNLRDSMYDMSSQIAPALGDYWTNYRYNRILKNQRKLENEAKSLGLDPELVIKARKNLNRHMNPDFGKDAFDTNETIEADAWNKYYKNY